MLIGYFPKRTTKRPDWLKPEVVEEVCSVANCVSPAPDGWINHWRHNAMGLFDTPDLALSVVPEADRNELDIYAYQMFPVRFIRGRQEPFAIPALPTAPLPASFELLGFDVVSFSLEGGFEHSPLSCNHMAETVTVNRYCLVDDRDLALACAAKFEGDGCEPGPYYVVAVWRLKRDETTGYSFSFGERASGARRPGPAAPHF